MSLRDLVAGQGCAPDAGAGTSNGNPLGALASSLLSNRNKHGEQMVHQGLAGLSAQQDLHSAASADNQQVRTRAEMLARHTMPGELFTPLRIVCSHHSIMQFAHT